MQVLGISNLCIMRFVHLLVSAARCMRRAWLTIETRHGLQLQRGAERTLSRFTSRLLGGTHADASSACDSRCSCGDSALSSETYTSAAEPATLLRTGTAVTVPGRSAPCSLSPSASTVVRALPFS